MRRKIQFPNLKSFSDFFPKVSPWVHNKSGGSLATFPAMDVGASDFDPNATFEVGNYLSVRGPEYQSFQVDELLDFIREYVETQMLHVDYDRTHFEVVRWPDGRALVLISHGKIIGSRWLGIIDADTIPELETVEGGA